MTPSSPAPPASARNAVRLIWAGAGVAILGIFPLLLQKDDLRREVEKSTLSIDVDNAVNAAIAVGVVAALIGCGLWIWMAIMNGKGRNWARITATVFGGLNIAFGLIGVVAGSRLSGATPLTTVLTIVSVVLAITIIVLMWQKDSSQWYAAMGRARESDQMVPVVPPPPPV